MRDGSSEAIRSVPDEMLVEIFAAYEAAMEYRGQSADPDMNDIQIYSMQPAPIFLGSICKRWRVVINSAPSLWTRISLTVHRSSQFAAAADHVRLFNARSGSFSLQIAIALKNHSVGFWPEDRISISDLEHCRPLVDALASSVERWQIFCILAPRGFMLRLQQALSQRTPWSLPRLEKLEMLEKWFPDWPFNETDNSVTMFEASPKLRLVRLSHGMMGAEDSDVKLPWHQLEQ